MSGTPSRHLAWMLLELLPLRKRTITDPAGPGWTAWISKPSAGVQVISRATVPVHSTTALPPAALAVRRTGSGATVGSGGPGGVFPPPAVGAAPAPAGGTP